MSFSRIYAVYIRQWFLIKSTPVRLISNFMWLIISIIQWGFISKYLDLLGSATFNLVTVLLGAIILWEFLTRVQQGVMMGFLEDVWRNNFINFFASPLRIWEYLCGLVLSSTLMTIIGFVLMAGMAGLFFGYNVLAIGFMMIPFLSVLFVFGMAIGIFISTIIFRYGSTAEWIAWPIPFILSIISGVFYPISTLPTVLQYLAYTTPATYVFESLRSVLAGKSFTADMGMALLAGGLLAFAYLALSYWLFVAVYRRNLKTGGITRFSVQ